MTWPVRTIPILPDLPEDPKEAFKIVSTYLKTTTNILQDLHYILKGQVSVAGMTEDEYFPNCNTAIVDMVQVPDIAVQVDNPLDREPLGILNLFNPESVRPMYDIYTSGTGVTAGDTEVTQTGTFASDAPYGYFTAQTHRVKIIARPTTTTLTLQDPWPGTTDAGIACSVMRRWHSDSVWLQFYGPAGSTGKPIPYRLWFF
jgi:hypothetical protein